MSSSLAPTSSTSPAPLHKIVHNSGGVYYAYQFYENQAAAYFERTKALGMQGLYAEFCPLLKAGSRILDVGCGSGRDCLAFSKMGFKVQGLDASATLASMAAEFSGVPCVHQDFRDLAFENAFDAIWACASLLHVSSQELPAVLQRLRRALVEQGVLYLSMKDGAKDLVTPDGRYFAMYERDGLQGMWYQAGFELVKYWPSESVVPGDSTRWHNAIVRKP